MKKLFIIALGFIVTNYGMAQQGGISRDENGNKVIVGFLSRQQLSTDTSFNWFQANQKGYIPDQAALQAMKLNRETIRIIAFGGTWCGDTKFILPKFFILADAAGMPEDHITVIGVDHNKKTIEHLSETFNIINVPTLIVMKEGKEIGRVVEYGKHGMFDKDLAEILNGPGKQ